MANLQSPGFQVALAKVIGRASVDHAFRNRVQEEPIVVFSEYGFTPDDQDEFLAYIAAHLQPALDAVSRLSRQRESNTFGHAMAAAAQPRSPGAGEPIADKEQAIAGGVGIGAGNAGTACSGAGCTGAQAASGPSCYTPSNAGAAGPHWSVDAQSQPMVGAANIGTSCAAAAWNCAGCIGTAGSLGSICSTAGCAGTVGSYGSAGVRLQMNAGGAMSTPLMAGRAGSCWATSPSPVQCAGTVLMPTYTNVAMLPSPGVGAASVCMGPTCVGSAGMWSATPESAMMGAGALSTPLSPARAGNCWGTAGTIACAGTFCGTAGSLGTAGTYGTAGGAQARLSAAGAGTVGALSTPLVSSGASLGSFATFCGTVGAGGIEPGAAACSACWGTGGWS